MLHGVPGHGRSMDATTSLALPEGLFVRQTLRSCWYASVPRTPCWVRDPCRALPCGCSEVPWEGHWEPWGVYPGAHSGALGVRGRGGMHCVVQGNGPSWGLQRACDALSACAPVVCCDLRRMAGPTRAPEALCLRVRAGVHCSTCHVVHSQPLEGQQPCADAQGTWTHTD